jgi:hypothetical protein
LLLNNIIVQLMEFVLVAMLVFMPLMVIHWADRRPLLRIANPERFAGRMATARAALMVAVSMLAIAIIL